MPESIMPPYTSMRPLTFQEVDTWLTRFAAGAGTLFEWIVTKDGYILARCEEKHNASTGLCPLSAQATLEEGEYVPRSLARHAAITQGLSWHGGSAIMDAADRVFDGRYCDAETVFAIRQRLLSICRVIEKG